VLATVTSGVVGVSPQNIYHDVLELSQKTVDFSGETTFRPRVGAAHSVLYALEIDQDLIAHTQMGMRVTQKILIVKI